MGRTALLALLLAGTLGRAAAAPLAELLDAARGDQALPAYLQPWIAKDREWGEQHRVLVQMVAGRQALLRGDLALAEALLGDAQREVESIYANDPRAQAARSVFVPEASKPFKGDPYERAMLGIYLGLIDLARGDYDNARAGFRFAQLQDTLSAAETYQDDMALAQYLLGWAYWCEGQARSAEEEFQHARRMRPDLPLPAPGDRLLMLAELGAAPVKFRSGEFGELQRLRAGAPTPLQQVAFAVDGKARPAVVGEDLLFQAATRGGAAVDAIRAGKASFKAGAQGIAQVGAAVGTGAFAAASLSAYAGQGNKDLGALGVVAGLVALGARGVAASSETLADIRYWSNLPSQVHLSTAPLPGVGDARPGVVFHGYSGRPLAVGQGQFWLAPRGQCGLFLAQAPAWPTDGRSAVPTAWPRLPPLRPPVIDHEHLAMDALDDEGESLLNQVRSTRESR